MTAVLPTEGDIDFKMISISRLIKYNKNHLPSKKRYKLELQALFNAINLQIKKTIKN